MAKGLSQEDVKFIASLKNEEGRKHLAKALGWPPFDEEDDPQHSIHLDYLYENLMFMIKKGFSWSAIIVLFEVAKSAIQESIGKSLPEAVQIFNELSKQAQAKVTEENLRQYTDYYFSTFMWHFKLYQYVFTRSRERQQINLTLPIETPDTPAPFAEAKDVDIYEYELKYKQLETAEQEAKEKRIQNQEAMRDDDLLRLQQSRQNVENVTPPLDRQKIIDIIHSVAGAHVISVSHEIQQNLQSTMEELKFMLEKTALERPQTLGAPPRYKPKTPLTGAAAAAAKKTPQSREKSGSKSRLSTKGSKRA